MDIAELEQESAELLPDRQALGCWKWSPCGHEASWGWGGGWSWSWQNGCWGWHHSCW